jgi:hypothetical protein
MKLCFEFILFHENADGTTTFFQFHIVGVPLKGRDEKITDQTQRGKDQGVAGEVAPESEATKEDGNSQVDEADPEKEVTTDPRKIRQVKTVGR